MQAAVKWRIILADNIIWHELDGELVVYNDLTGNTHVLNPLAGMVLRRLTDSGVAHTVVELTESLGSGAGIDPGNTYTEAVDAVLGELERFGIVVRCTA